MTQHYNLVVIGGGLIARSFVRACRHLPLSIAVIEASPPSTTAARTFAINPMSKQFFQTLGCWPERVTPIKHIHVSQQRRLAKARLHAEDMGVDALGYCVAEQAFLDTLTDEDHATWYCPNRCQALAFSDKYTLTLDDGQQLSADLLIAADGAHSFVRQALNIDCHTRDFQQAAIIANLRCEQHHQYTAYERFTAQGPIALLPIDGRWMNLVYTTHATDLEHKLQMNDTEFLAHCHEMLGYRLGRYLEITPRVSFPLVRVETQQVVARHCVFIGNAAQTLHPVAGQGFNLGIRDVAILADVLTQCVKRQQSFTCEESLHEYARWRHQHQQHIVQLTDNLATWFLPQSLGLPLWRGLGIQALEWMMPVKRHFCRRAMGVTENMPDLLCGIPLEV